MAQLDLSQNSWAKTKIPRFPTLRYMIDQIWSAGNWSSWRCTSWWTWKILSQPWGTSKCFWLKMRDTFFLNVDIPFDYFFWGSLIFRQWHTHRNTLAWFWLILNGLDRQGFTIAARAIAGVGKATGTFSDAKVQGWYGRNEKKTCLF